MQRNWQIGTDTGNSSGSRCVYWHCPVHCVDNQRFDTSLQLLPTYCFRRTTTGCVQQRHRCFATISCTRFDVLVTAHIQCPFLSHVRQKHDRLGATWPKL